MSIYNKLRYRIKSLISKEKGLYSFFHKITGLYPNDIEIYKTACRHRSCSKRSKNGANNERLEYLGDAVLNTIIADFLYNKFQRAHEGFLTATRSNIVKRETLNRVAEEIGLTAHVESKASNSHNSFLGGNALEALIGAVYIDQGYENCTKFVIEKILKKHVNLHNATRRYSNNKSLIIEWAQKNKKEIEFRLDSTEFDENHNPIIHSTILIDNVEKGSGIGYSKRESHQRAAKKALKAISAETPKP